MADGQVGGNESVHWLVNADDASAVKDGPNGKKWRQSGIDYHQNASLGEDFIVRIKLPREAARRKVLLEALLADVNAALNNPGAERLELKLEIETGPVARTQIQICWGDIPPWSEGLQAVHPVKEEKETRRIGGMGV
jgi:hypothetical protein